MPITTTGLVFKGLEFPLAGEGSFEDGLLQRIVEDAHWQVTVASERLSELIATMESSPPISDDYDAGYVVQLPRERTPPRSLEGEVIGLEYEEKEKASRLFRTMHAEDFWFANEYGGTGQGGIMLTSGDMDQVKQVRSVVDAIRGVIEAESPQGYLAADLPNLWKREPGPPDWWHFKMWNNAKKEVKEKFTEPRESSPEWLGEVLQDLKWDDNQTHIGMDTIFIHELAHFVGTEYPDMVGPIVDVEEAQEPLEYPNVLHPYNLTEICSWSVYDQRHNAENYAAMIYNLWLGCEVDHSRTAAEITTNLAGFSLPAITRTGAAQNLSDCTFEAERIVEEKFGQVNEENVNLLRYPDSNVGIPMHGGKGSVQYGELRAYGRYIFFGVDAPRIELQH